ncbi:DUF2652 domain-containing protein [Flavimarina sp. Hel_I_48]|uniref:DUF2652 domain-containing protein n=1 Tax=Flavimarina sp. Hel_I_48 TaxID=1392488 RepID=UPI0006904A9D|nr:DUF2652 domain-containing protein [Flavimarina sp. Hel_I_48]
MKTTITKRPIKKSQLQPLDSSFEGTLLIPDISGFTKFVNETEFNAGREITKQLLQVILNNNILDLKISEIEGDAVLFYTKVPLTPIQIKNQYEVMLESFTEKILQLSKENGFEINLSLKLIAHYGELSTYSISNFEKLYGKTVIEAHKLLKNNIVSDSYLLLTESVFYANKGRFKGTCYYSSSQLCEVYGHLKKIGYIYLDYKDDKDSGTIDQVNDFLNYKPRSTHVLQ